MGDIMMFPCLASNTPLSFESQFSSGKLSLPPSLNAEPMGITIKMSCLLWSRGSTMTQARLLEAFFVEFWLLNWDQYKEMTHSNEGALKRMSIGSCYWVPSDHSGPYFYYIFANLNLQITSTTFSLPFFLS